MSSNPISTNNYELNNWGSGTEHTQILLIGKLETYNHLSLMLKNESNYDLTYIERVDLAINYLLQNSYGIVILDQQIESIDIISVSTTVRKNHPLARIVLISSIRDSKNLAKIVNHGSIDAILEVPLFFENVYKILSAQDAKYSISKALTSFVSQPPKLSKASFLLLDPSLSFGDEKQPLNFVGVMITNMTVPRFTLFFEEVLAHDEFLLMGYLSSITALGDELFNSKESLKEINFGGISVIFRFHETLQISFLVRNLSRHNYEKAEKRIDAIVNEVIQEHGVNLMQRDLTREEEDLINQKFHQFDHQDSKEMATYQSGEASKTRKEFGHQIVLIITTDTLIEQELSTILLQEKEHLLQEDPNLHFHVKTAQTEEEAVDIVKFQNCGVVIIDYLTNSNLNPLHLAELVKEFTPAIQTILLTRDPIIDQNLVDSINNDFIDYIVPLDAEYGQLLTWALKGLEIAASIKQNTAMGETLDGVMDSSTIAKSLLRNDLSSFDVEIKPDLSGLMITKNLEIVYDHFFSQEGGSLSLNKEMLVGLVTSLKDVGGEMFTRKETISTLQIAGAEAMVKQISDFLFVYFVTNLNPNTSVLVSKELDAVSSVFFEIITEAGEDIPLDLLEPIFTQIAEKTQRDFTSLFRQSKK